MPDTTTSMLKNYLSSTLRHLLKNRSYAILNTLGLSVGLACFTLIGLWVIDELSYDRFHEKSDRIYRVSATFSSESDDMQQAVTPTPLRKALVSDLPEVEAAVILDNNDAIVQRGEKQLMEDYLLMTEPAFFDLFSFRLISGDKKTALRDPYSVILSEQMARRYFGEEDPVGQQLVLYLQDPEGKGKAYTVTGIIEDCPANTHFKYQALISFSTHEANNPTDPRGYDWYNNGYYTYILLREGASSSSLEAKLPQLIEKYMGKQNREWKIEYAYFLQPLIDIHLHSKLKYEIQETSSLTYVIVFATIGCLVLLLACINYVNMATAFASRRLKEVGIRKAMGAFRGQLIGQYLAESCWITLASLLLAFVWIEWARTLFESIAGRPVTGLYEPGTLFVLIALTCLVGILSGSYPAIMLSSLHPSRMHNDNLLRETGGGWLRKSLVTVQFVVTLLLVAGVFVVQRQLHYMQNRELGFDQEGLLMMGVNGSREVIDNYAAFANEVKLIPGIGGVARSNSMLAGGLGNSVATMVDASGKDRDATVYRLRTDFDYLNAYGMKLAAGRFFDQTNAADSMGGFVVNEALIRFFGYTMPEEALGRKFVFQGREGKVIGVVRDFHYHSLQYRIEPTCLYLLRQNFSQIGVQLEGNVSVLRTRVEEVWKKHFPNTLLDSSFADEALNRQYASEQRLSTLVLVFSGLSLVIACLGLFALVSFAVECRTKEIGIRKVLGASVRSIVALLTKEFAMLILAASLVALPAGYYFLNQWLAGFAYHMELDPMLFILATLTVVLVAGATVSARSAKAASANPVKALRNE
ncbi:MAG: ABC transporter permease [Cyclobacteriaceae bacterium]|nr:ABC transporter permease [Cyclobacteriaceae bacterium]